MTTHTLSDASPAVRRLIIVAVTANFGAAVALLFNAAGRWPSGLALAAALLVQLRALQSMRTATTGADDADPLLRTLVDTTPGVIYAKDRDGRMLLANAAALELIGKPWAVVKGRNDVQFLDDPAQGKAIMANDRHVMASGSVQKLEELVGSITWLSTKMPVRDAAGNVTGIVGISVDITERKQVEERLRQMVNELNHRVKNTLASVQSIVAHTLAGVPAGTRHTLERRLIAMAATHDVLTRERWEGADVLDIVNGVLAPHGVPGDPRFSIGGPRVKLVRHAALAISMALHELATNAAKFGALSCESGAVDLRWNVMPAEDQQFSLVWRERGGPRVVAPTLRGFGIKLVERSVAYDLGGSARVAFAPDGVVCEIRAPLEEIAARPEAAPLPRVGIMR